MAHFWKQSELPKEKGWVPDGMSAMAWLIKCQLLNQYLTQNCD